MRVLIVEDSFLVRQMIKDAFSTQVNCDVAVNGEEAVLAFRTALEEKHPYHLICMDIRMPGMDGIQALKQIREIEKAVGITPVREVKVIMLTACDDPKTVVDAFYRAGATSYLAKPFDETSLMQEVHNLGFP